MENVRFVFNDGGRADAGYKGKTGDCVCRSIAIVTGIPYNEVYKRLAEGNANQRKSKYDNKTKAGVKTAARGINVKRKWFMEYMKELGLVWTSTMKIGQGCKVHLRKEELPAGKIIVAVSGHYTAVIDGIINDTYDCSRDGNRCVYGYYSLKS